MVNFQLANERQRRYDSGTDNRSNICLKSRYRDLRAGKLGQDHVRAARDRRGAEERRHRRLHRCRACARSDLCPKARRRRRQLIVSQPDTGEQALEIVDTLVRSNAVDILVVDSVARSGAARRDRGRDGRQPCRPPGAPDVAVAAGS